MRPSTLIQPLKRLAFFQPFRSVLADSRNPADEWDSRPSIPSVADRRIAQLLAERFEHQLEQATIGSLAFYVENGNVTVTGVIGNRADVRILLGLVRSVSGVQSADYRPDLESAFREFI